MNRLVPAFKGLKSYNYLLFSYRGAPTIALVIFLHHNFMMELIGTKRRDFCIPPSPTNGRLF